jgi:hypothetical protein
MPRPKLNFVVLDPGSGKARPGALVTIYAANTLSKATLYADDDVTQIANPVQANGLGQVAMRVGTGVYDVSMVWDGAQPTVVEDVLAWTPAESVLSAKGDLIVGDATGEPTRLPVGAPGQILTPWQGSPVWSPLTAATGIIPYGPAGTLFTYDSAGRLQAILPGTQDQALAMAGGIPTWVSTLLPPGTTLPINQPGDLVVGAVGTGLPARLAAGTVGSPLTVGDNNALVWGEPGAVGPGGGQCYLVYNGDDQLLWLLPAYGNKIWVNGRSRTIPDGGISLAPTGLSLYTAYYIYVAWDGSALKLEPSTVGFAQTGGLWHKSGDMSRTLVGYAWVTDVGTGGPSWTDTDYTRGVLSLFNQDERTGHGQLTAYRSITSEAAVEVHPEIRCYFIAWGFTNITMTMTGSAYVNPAGHSFTSFLTLDGVGVAAITLGASATNVRTNITSVATRTLPAQDMIHTLSLYGAVSAGGTATWEGEPSGLFSARVGVTIAT